MKNDDRARNLVRDSTKKTVLLMGILCSAFVASSAAAQETTETSPTAPTGPGAPIAPLPATAVDLSTPSDGPPVIATEHHFLNRPLFVSGLVLFGGTYTASMIVGAESSRDQDHKDLFYPLVGPWMDIGHRDCYANNCTNEAGAVTLLILDGIGQGLGVLTLITAIAVPERVTRKYFFGNEKLSVTPMRIGLAAYGLGAHGSF